MPPPMGCEDGKHGLAGSRTACGAGRKGQGEARAAGPHAYGLGCHQVFWFKIPTAVPSVQFLLNQNSQARRGRRRAAGEGRACGLAERRRPRLPRRADCAFRSRRRPRGAGPNRPPACGALWRTAQLGKRARATPRQPAGGLRRGPQASVWGLTARKDAVWAEGLADGAPWARPGTMRLPVVG